MDLNVHDGTSLVALFGPAARTATVNGSAADMRDFRGKLSVILGSAAGTGTTPTLDVKLQDSADGTSGWADIPGAVFSQVTTVASQQAIGLNVDEARQFIRGVATIGGTGPSFNFVLFTLGRKQVAA